MQALRLVAEMQRAKAEGRPMSPEFQHEMRRRWVRKHDGYMDYEEIYNATVLYAQSLIMTCSYAIAETIADGAEGGCLTQGEMRRAVDALKARDSFIAVP